MNPTIERATLIRSAFLMSAMLAPITGVWANQPPVIVPAVADVEVSAGNPVQTKVGSSSLTVSDSFSGISTPQNLPFSDSATASAVYSKDSSVSVFASGSNYPGINYQAPFAQAELDYYFIVSAPANSSSSGALVPVDLSFAIQAFTNSPNASGLATVSIDSTDSFFSYDRAFTGCPSFSTCAFSEMTQVNIKKLSLQLQPDVVMLVSLGAVLPSTDLATSGPYSAALTVDPVLAIDPDFAAQHPGYTIQFSPGMDIVPGVPEPDVGTTLIVGFGGLGLAQWIRRRRARVSTSLR